MVSRSRTSVGTTRFVALGASVILALGLTAGSPVGAQSTGANITDATQPPVAMPPLYAWDEVTKGPKFKGATPAALATDASGNIVMVGAKWTRRDNGTVVPSALAWHSTDGVTWTSPPVPDPDGQAIQSVIHADSGFLAVSANGFLTSPTGEAWSASPGADVLGDGGHGVALARTPSGYVAVGVIAVPGSDGKVSRTPAAWSSTDAVSWQQGVLSADEGSASLVVVGDDGTMIASGLARPKGAKKSAWEVWRSTDGGVTWASVEAPRAKGYPVLAFAAGRFLLGYLVSDEFLAPSGWWSSVDGVTWEGLPDDLQQTELLAGVGGTALAITGTTVMDNAHVGASVDAVAWETADGGYILGPGEAPAALIGLPDGRLLIAGSTKKSAFLWIGTSTAPLPVLSASPSVEASPAALASPVGSAGQ